MSKIDTLTDEEKQELCKKCQWCCTHVFLPLAKGPNYIPFYRDVRGMEIKFHKFEPWLIIENPCQHLTKDGCRIYKNRPDACKDFDGRLMIFHADKCQWNKKGVSK